LSCTISAAASNPSRWFQALTKGTCHSRRREIHVHYAHSCKGNRLPRINSDRWRGTRAGSDRAGNQGRRDIAAGTPSAWLLGWTPSAEGASLASLTNSADGNIFHADDSPRVHNGTRPTKDTTQLLPPLQGVVLLEGSRSRMRLKLAGRTKTTCLVLRAMLGEVG
jgi:hypothetical protein